MECIHCDGIKSEAELGNDIGLINDIISAALNPTLNFSKDDNPFGSTTDVSPLTLGKDQEWQPYPYDNSSDTYEYPKPSMETREKWVVVATQFHKTCDAANYRFGNLDGLLQISTADGEPPSGCFAVAQLNYTAGVSRCSACRVIVDGVVEMTASQVNTVEPHPLVDTAIAMMPEVLDYMERENASSAPQWNNLDGYARGMLSIAYQTSWNALASDSSGEPGAQTSYEAPFQVLVAAVTKWRAAVWYAVTLLLPISGIAMAIVQSKCRFKGSDRPCYNSSAARYKRRNARRRDWPV